MTSARDLSSVTQSWSLIDCAHRAGDERAVAACGAGHSPAGWLPATVPGLVAQDLIVASRIPDPYWGDNVQQARWIEERDWVYRTVVTIAKGEAQKPARLVCESLDTFATVVLNGEVIARHENQFRRLVVDVTGKLKPGDNVLVIAFEASWPATVRRAGPKRKFWNEPWERLYVRKSQMSFGWDWAARTPTVGVCDPIRLEFSDGVWAGDLWARGKPTANGGGEIRASLDLERAANLPDGALTAELLVNGKMVASADVAFTKGGGATVDLAHQLERARLWNPRELGTPHLYRVAIRVKRDKQVVHQSEARCGVRDVQLVTKDACSPNGNVFWFAVNGQRMWCKGDNWLPLDFLHTRVTRAQYESYLKLLMAGGVNCIRVWGGGIVEHQDFYDLCDELGLLVWHDFGYACGVYPDDPAFLAEAKREGEDVVRRLRSHPSIALWCGNNENEALAWNEARDDEKARFHPIYYEILSDVVKRLDPERAYHPGSPASPSRQFPPDAPDEGDRHNWDVWFGWRNTDRITDDARFNSEFGAQSFPQRETIESFMRPDAVWSPGFVSAADGPSPGYLFARHGAQLDKLVNRAAWFGPTANLDQLIATTQAFHADTVGRYIRHYRRLLPLTGGVVLWNYTATWPSICWAAVDWYRRPKQAYYECKRCFRPATVGIEPLDEAQSAYAAYASVDRAANASGEVTLELRAIATGAVVASEKAKVALKGPAAQEAVRLTLPAGLDRARHALVATWRHAAGEERDVRYLVPIAQAIGFGGALTATREAERVVVRAKGWRLRVGVEGFEAPAVWNDNYVDLLPGEERAFAIEYGAMPEHQWIVADMGTRRVLAKGATIEL